MVNNENYIMNSLNFLYYVLAAGFLLIVALLSIVLYQAIKTIMVLRLLIQETREMATDVNEMKTKLKYGTESVVGSLLNMIFRGGNYSGRLR